MPFCVDISDRYNDAPRRAPHVPTTGELIARDERRLAVRAEVKEKIARAQLAEVRLGEIDATIAAVNERKEMFAAEHVAAARPIQQELGEIEQRAIDAIVKREPTDSAADARRKELLADLESLNRDLESSIAAEDKTLTRLFTDRFTTAKLCNESVLVGDLLRLARPDLKIASEVAESARRWAEHRLNSATERATKFGRSDFVAAEIRAAESEGERCREAAAKALQEILDE